MAVANAFSKEEMAIDSSLGYPKAYAKLCKDTSFSPYSNGPPFTFIPYTLHSQEVSRANELDEMFPVIDKEAKPTSKTRIFVGMLWKQLNHLGNAGFDPSMFRVDPYGNVLYFHADPASPLSWAIDHWFPCSRGGLTVPSNLRILQWQVCTRKHNQLEYLVPWWDLQLGISVNHFLSIFAATNSDFRCRAFRLLFQAGENEELTDLQTVGSYNFSQAYIESKEQLGLAPAAIKQARKESSDVSSSTLRSLDINRQPRPSTPMIAAAKKFKNSELKENEMPDMVTNPYQAIVMARNSLKQRDETNKMKVEIQRLGDGVNEYQLKNEEERLTIQELEMALIKRRRWAEKCRKLAEAQSAHKAMLEKMIRNSMHQSVVYKEQLRLNQAATNTLMARLEAQIAICNSDERELHKKYKQRDELEKYLRAEPEQARKRLRIEDYDTLVEEKEDRTLIYTPRTRERHFHKQLREFFEEEQKLSEAALALIEERKTEGNDEPDSVMEEMIELPKGLSMRFAQDAQVEEDEESRKERGKGNVDKWLQMLLEDTEGDESGTSRSDDIITMLNEKYPQKEIKMLRLPGYKQKAYANEEVVEMETSQICKEEFDKCKESKKPRSMSTPRRSISSEADIIGNGGEPRKSFGGGKEKWDKNLKDRGVAKSESARFLRSLPSSPSKILNMGKRADCLRKKPLVLEDEDEYGDENQAVSHNFLQSSMKTIKKTVKS